MVKRIGIVFPGYGEQFIGMGKDLYDELRIVQEIFEQAASSTDINFVKLLFASSDEDISKIPAAYLATFLIEASLYEVLYEKGLRPDFVAGYGIGEYAAAYATRSLSFIDGVYILNKYAQFYHEFLKDKDYTVLRIVREFELQTLQDLCEKYSTETEAAYVSAQNTFNAFYVAGSESVVEKIQKYCIDEVIRKVKVIGSSYEMHSMLVDPVVDQLKPYFHKIQFKNLEVPLITNVDGVYVTSPDALESAIMRKANNPVQWLEVMKGFEGCDVILSVGPGGQLIEWFKESYPDKEYHIVSSLADFGAIQSLFFSPIIAEDVAAAIASEQTSDEKKDLYLADLINELPTDFDIDDDEDEI